MLGLTFPTFLSYLPAARLAKVVDRDLLADRATALDEAGGAGSVVDVLVVVKKVDNARREWADAGVEHEEVKWARYPPSGESADGGGGAKVDLLSLDQSSSRHACKVLADRLGGTLAEVLGKAGEDYGATLGGELEWRWGWGRGWKVQCERI